MDKSSGVDIPLPAQRQAWEQWNSVAKRGTAQASPVSMRQAACLDRRLSTLRPGRLSLLDVGCGNGWICERLVRYGEVTGVDLVEDALEEARARLPGVRFVSGDFFEVALPLAKFDVVVSMEVLSCVADQAGFVKRLAALLKHDGKLFLTTGNKPVLERWSEVGGPVPGQIRRWLDVQQLGSLLNAHFREIEIESICPVGDQGYLRVVNSVKLNKVAKLLTSERAVERLKERLMLGHTLVAWARKPR